MADNSGKLRIGDLFHGTESTMGTGRGENKE